ncbi:hypothetical protein BH11MYX1_BH11MYX1_54100 [soil metagenome]
MAIVRSIAAWNRARRSSGAIHQAEAADNYDDASERSRDHLGRWQDLPDSHLLDNEYSLSHLAAQGIHYYLPAVMSFASRHPTAHERDHSLTESLEYTLQPSGRDLRGYQETRFSRLDREQRAAIYAFTRVAGHAEAAAAWSRVFEAELEAGRDAWFELFNPGAAPVE